MTNFAISKDNNGARLDQGGQKKSRNRVFQHATGWQAHSVRDLLSGRGCSIRRPALIMSPAWRPARCLMFQGAHFALPAN